MVTTENKQNNSAQKPARVNCFQCKYFKAVYDFNYPKICELFGFRGKKMPSIVVYESTGSVCLGFEQKEKKVK